MLQKSVWLTPYNPREVLQDFIQERNLKGAVIISSLGKNASIGGDSLLEIVEKVYMLKKINKKYEEYLKKYNYSKTDSIKAVFAFLAILKEDPQLPFDLLPGYWSGWEAYILYKKHLEFLRKTKMTEQNFI